MPYSIPLARRIQFHLDAKPVSTTARVFVAVAADADDVEHTGSVRDDERDKWLDGWLESSSSSSPSSPSRAQGHSPSWVAAHIDLVNQGQTQVWVFASWEDPATFLSATTTTPAAATTAADAHSFLMTHLFKYIYTHLVPDMPTAPDADWLELKRTGKYLTQPYSRNKILFGTVGEKLWAHFPSSARARTDSGYLKYIFSPEQEEMLEQEQEQAADTSTNTNTDTCTNTNTPTPPPGTLPADYRFTDLQPHDLQAVLDRTPVPRTLATLSQLVSVGLLYKDSPQPVGWGFLGKDASISSLHTEVEHRGRGLAVCLSRELLRRQGRGFAGRGHEEGEGRERQEEAEGKGRARGVWAHADVSGANVASRRVMEKLGGKPVWTVMWTELDLGVLLG